MSGAGISRAKTFAEKLKKKLTVADCSIKYYYNYCSFSIAITG